MSMLLIRSVVRVHTNECTAPPTRWHVHLTYIMNKHRIRNKAWHNEHDIVPSESTHE